ncbi:efflux transporter periplasmic adaptor subunit [Chitinophaga caeni]|uniref:Efflux transporter periplasmic adaptor subunit n=1 Tax=Chitinophaga caeni TaxID=2029983 RepID=A0A291QQN7_9BACT|nr:efflux RND transporter periplasmic adaptor subunit [Chitinophaga caeni]ATL46192.1 efflux transporter periplasmic adaptor subunit [Chitinophaga caeni]
MRRFINISFLSLCSLGGLFLLPSCGENQAHENKQDSTAVEAPAIQSTHPFAGALSSTIKIPGELVAYQQVDLYAKVNSFVSKLYADVGSEVKAGQLLAEMEAPELNAQLNGAASKLKAQEAIYLASKSNYDRLLETSKTPGTISPNDLDQAFAKQQSDLAQLEAAKAAYREVTDTKNYLQVRAPFSGVITARNVSAGAYVGPSGKGSELPLFTLHQQDHLRLVVSVPEAYIHNLRQGSEVAFTVRSLPNEQFKANLSRLAGALDTRLRAQRIEMDVYNKNRELLPGMVSEISIPLLGDDSAFVVPSTAVLNSTLGVYLIKVINKKTVWIPVTTGRSENGKTEVFGDISASDTIVVAATEEIRNGSEIEKIALAKE